jgi:hypothetical protein
MAVLIRDNAGWGSENLMAASDILIDGEKQNLVKSLQSANVTELIK